jgi:hypothetical protein
VTVEVSIPSNDIKTIVRDMNAKVGQEEIYKGTIWLNSLHTGCNDDGRCLTDFSQSRNLIISSTFFPHRNIHKHTWVSPDGEIANQIDHTLIEKRGTSSIMDVRSIRGITCGSDHYLIRATFRCKLMTYKRVTKDALKKINVETLNDPKIATIFKQGIQEQNIIAAVNGKQNNNESNSKEKLKINGAN